MSPRSPVNPRVAVEVDKAVSAMRSRVRGVKITGAQAAKERLRAVSSGVSEFLANSLQEIPSEAHITQGIRNELEGHMRTGKPLNTNVFRSSRNPRRAVEGAQEITAHIGRLRNVVAERNRMLLEEREREGRAGLFEGQFYSQAEARLRSLEQELMGLESSLFKIMQAKEGKHSGHRGRKTAFNGRR